MAEERLTPIFIRGKEAMISKLVSSPQSMIMEYTLESISKDMSDRKAIRSNQSASIYYPQIILDQPD